MKIGVIPDIHGCPAWKENVKKMKDVDKIVFLGDIFDSFNKEEKGLNALENAREIFKFVKETNSDFLIGNHEFENYLFHRGKCSGFQSTFYSKYHELLLQNLPLIKVAIEYDGWVFSHAGISKKWLEDILEICRGDKKNPIEFLNSLFKEKPVYFEYNDTDYSGYGNSINQTPLWIRPEALVESHYFNKQVVGHTEMNKITTIEKNGLTLILTDTPKHNGYYILDTEVK